MFRTFDSSPTYNTRDARVLDSAGAFLNGELERLDQTIHDPIAAVTWTRDIDVRTDVTMGDEASSFANMTFASPGGYAPTGKAWISKNANAIQGIEADIGKIVNPLTLWGMELAYTIPELVSSQQVNRPIDVTKYTGMKLKYNMDVDEMCYVGDAQLGVYGLTNQPSVTATNVTNGVSGSPKWANKTFQEMMNDVNVLLTNAWAASGYAFVPSKLLLPPAEYSIIANTLTGQAGSQSVMTYLKMNSIATAMNGRELEIVPVKWLTGRGAGGTDRMAAYTQDLQRIRIPLVPLQNTAVQPRGIHMLTYYYARIGVVEVTQTEMIAYADGIG